MVIRAEYKICGKVWVEGSINKEIEDYKRSRIYNTLSMRYVKKLKCLTAYPIGLDKKPRWLCVCVCLAFAYCTMHTYNNSNSAMHIFIGDEVALSLSIRSFSIFSPIQSI